MSLIFIEGFDHLSSGQETEKWDFASDGYTSAMDTPGRGSRGKALKVDTGSLGKFVPMRTAYVMGFAFKTDTFPTTTPWDVCSFGMGRDAQIKVSMLSSGKLQAKQGGSPSGSGLLGVAGRTLSLNTWYYIEFKALIDAYFGYYEIRVDGTTDSSATDISTLGVQFESPDPFYAADASYISQVTLGPYSSGTLSKYAWYDDLYVCDLLGYRNNDFQGDCRVDTSFPVDNGFHSDLIGTDANSTDNYLLVDDTSASFTDAVSSYAPGETDTYKFGAMPYEPINIVGVQVTAYMKRTSALFRAGALVTRIDNIDYVQGRRGISTSNRMYTQTNELSPSGAGLWSKALVDAAEFGVKVVG